MSSEAGRIVSFHRWNDGAYRFPTWTEGPERAFYCVREGADLRPRREPGEERGLAGSHDRPTIQTDCQIFLEKGSRDLLGRERIVGGLIARQHHEPLGIAIQPMEQPAFDGFSPRGNQYLGKALRAPSEKSSRFPSLQRGAVHAARLENYEVVLIFYDYERLHLNGPEASVRLNGSERAAAP